MDGWCGAQVLAQRLALFVPALPVGSEVPACSAGPGFAGALASGFSFFFGNFIEMSLYFACQLSLFLLNKGLLNGLIAPGVGSSL